LHEERIAAILAALPEADLIPDLVNIFARGGKVSRPDWDLPILSCLAVGGAEADGIVGCAAIACLQISIILIDDMLDDDPKGEYHVRGSGPTANLALAFQSAAFRLLDDEALPHDIKSASCSCLAHIALATAAGQGLDTSNLRGEENYWRVIKAKSTPFYGGALQIGGILGKAAPETTEELYKIGVIIGEIIQVEDDLHDSFEVPANPDWMAGRNNLLLLYASSAPHPDQERFKSLRYLVEDHDSLLEAQKILISSGALSYSAYQLIDRYKKAKELLASTQLANRSPIENILDDYAASLIKFLQESGADIPSDLLI
jgi:geranylgeranyl pyrophosphate synthase